VSVSAALHCVRLEIFLWFIRSLICCCCVVRYVVCGLLFAIEVVASFVFLALERADAVCLAEVGAPVIAALKRGLDRGSSTSTSDAPVLAVSAATKNAQPGQAGACEARTAVVARMGKQEPDVRVSVGGKARNFAVVRVAPGLAIVAVHLMHSSSAKNRARLAAGEALLDMQARLGGCVLAAGDWNFELSLDKLGVATHGSLDSLCGLPGAPTTYADEVTNPTSRGIDGALVLSPPAGATLSVEVVGDL
jgi:hypothetical protein